jgi:hypothetical protein
MTQSAPREPWNWSLFGMFMARRAARKSPEARFRRLVTLFLCNYSGARDLGASALRSWSLRTPSCKTVLTSTIRGDAEEISIMDASCLNVR